MLIKEGLGSRKLFLDDKSRDIRLLPEEREGSPDLRIAVDLSLVGAWLLTDHDLLELDKVGNVAILIDATV